MARTNKSGIDYFPFDIDFFNDEKIEFTSARFGVKGEVIAIRLLCKIYRNGYYTEWNEDESTILAKRAGDGVSPTLVSDIVRELVKRGFFDKEIFDRFSILTSRGIQNRYFEATKRYKSIEVFKQFLLLDVSKFDNVNIINLNVHINNENENINPQREREIEKEIEIEKEKEKVSGGIPPPPRENINYLKILEFYHLNCPKMPKVEILNETRKSALKARYKEVGSERIELMLKNAGESVFLNGTNDRNWIANFDWLFGPKNFMKVLEGNYKNTIKNGSNQSNNQKHFAQNGYDIPM